MVVAAVMKGYFSASKQSKNFLIFLLRLFY